MRSDHLPRRSGVRVQGEFGESEVDRGPRQRCEARNRQPGCVAAFRQHLLQILRTTPAVGNREREDLVNLRLQGKVRAAHFSKRGDLNLKVVYLMDILEASL